jgi:hypothetical protein
MHPDPDGGCEEGPPMRTRTRPARLLKKNWGWLTLALAIIGWFSGFEWPVLIVLSLLSGIYFLFEAPVGCGVPIKRDGTPCGNNARGLLMGCPFYRHKWMRLQILVSPGNWGHGLWDTPKDRLNTLAALATVCSFAGSVIGAAG